MQQIRVKGLTALSMPGGAAAGVPDPPNLVNDLRFVFNHTFGAHYQLLPTASYPEGDLPYDYKAMRVP